MMQQRDVLGVAIMRFVVDWLFLRIGNGKGETLGSDMDSQSRALIGDHIPGGMSADTPYTFCQWC